MSNEVGIPLVVLLIALCTFTSLNRLTINSQNVIIDNLKTKVERLETKTVKRQYSLTITAYTTSKDETNSNPNKTALMRKPVPGKTIAISRDLKRFFGAKVWIEGVGIREVDDCMNKRFEKRIDVLVPTKEQAMEFGKKERTVVFYKLNR